MADRIVLNSISYHGKGAIENIVPELQNRGKKKVLVCTDASGIVEVQGTGERSTLSRAELDALLDMSQAGVAHLIEIQNQATGFRS